MPNLSYAERAKIYAATMAILELTGDPTTREEAERAGWCAAVSLFDVYEIGALMAVARGIEDLIDDRAEIGCVAYISDLDITRAISRCSIRASTAAMLAGLIPVDTAMSGRNLDRGRSRRAPADRPRKFSVGWAAIRGKNCFADRQQPVFQGACYGKKCLTLQCTRYPADLELWLGILIRIADDDRHVAWRNKKPETLFCQTGPGLRTTTVRVPDPARIWKPDPKTEPFWMTSETNAAEAAETGESPNEDAVLNAFEIAGDEDGAKPAPVIDLDAKRPPADRLPVQPRLGQPPLRSPYWTKRGERMRAEAIARLGYDKLSAAIAILGREGVFGRDPNGYDGVFEHNCITLAAALATAEAGLKVIDCHGFHADGKPTLKSGTIKRPRGNDWDKEVTTDRAAIIARWTGRGRYPEKDGEARRYASRTAPRNLGISTGGDVFGVDLDGPEGVAWLEAHRGDLPETVVNISGSGGRHLLFRLPAGEMIRNTVSRMADGVDIRGEGGFIVAGFSVHPSFNFYRFADRCAPWECGVADAPDWLIEDAQAASKPSGTPKKAGKKKATAKKVGKAADAAGSNAANDDAADPFIAAGGPVGFDEHCENIGHGEGQGGFDDPINRAALAWFASERRGDEEAREELKALLKPIILAAPCDDTRNVDRYATDAYLDERLAKAWSYIETGAAKTAADDDTADEPEEDAAVAPASAGRKAVSLNIADPLGPTMKKSKVTLAKRWAAVNVGGKVLFTPRPDPDAAACGDVQFFTPSQFTKFHENRFFWKKTDKGTKKQFPAVEFASETDRYAAMTFAPPPARADRNVLNLWQGYRVERTSPGSCEKLKAFISDVICAGRGDVHDWLWRWLAHAVQRPGEKPGSALVLQGEGRTGKSYFAGLLTRMFAPHTVFADNSNHVAGQFNKHLATAVLLVSDEALFGGDPRISGQIKSLVTSETQRIEAKGVDSVEMPSFLRAVFIGNPKRVVPIEANGSERRYLCLTVPTTQQDNTVYFAALEAEVQAGGLAGLLAELRAYVPADGWAGVRSAIETTERARMRRLSLPPGIRAMIDAIEDGVIELREEAGTGIRYELEDEAETRIERKHMRAFVAQARDRRDGGQDAREILKDLFGNAVSETRAKVTYKKRDRDGEWNGGDQNRAHCYVLPARSTMLATIRKRFEGGAPEE